MAPIVDIKRVLLKQNGEVKTHELISTIGGDARCEHPDLSGSYLINLERLGLVEIPRESFLTKPNVYDRLVNDVLVQLIVENMNKFGGEEYKADFDKYYVRCTVFGKQFHQACVFNRDKT